MQLASVMTHLSDAQAKNRKEVENRMTLHIQKARKVFEEYERRAKQGLSQAYQR